MIWIYYPPGKIHPQELRSKLMKLYNSGGINQEDLVTYLSSINYYKSKGKDRTELVNALREMYNKYLYKPGIDAKRLNKKKGGVQKSNLKRNV
jgi:endonuclease III